MRKPHRLYRASDIIDGIKTLGTLRQKAQEFAPNNMLQPAPTHEGYCTTCRGKKTFEIGETKPLKNGALHHKGKCPDCGNTVSAFAAGVKDAP